MSVVLTCAHGNLWTGCVEPCKRPGCSHSCLYHNDGVGECVGSVKSAPSSGAEKDATRRFVPCPCRGFVHVA